MSGETILRPEDFRPARAPERAPGRREVHLWSARLDPPPERVEALRTLLLPEELEQAARFRFDRHRRRFIVRRGVLKQLLGGYLDVDPASVVLAQGKKGKPYVPQPETPADDRLHFNLSDSGDVALYALTRGAELGVDVEVLRAVDDADGIAEHFFAAEEREVLRAVPAERKSEVFLCCWTRKEAYIKAIGEGLSEPLDRFCVSILPEEPARFLHLGGDPSRAAGWTLHHLVPEPGAVAALALEGPGWTLTETCRYVLAS